jgi:hypothetical protein
MNFVTIKATVYWAQLKKKNDLSGKYQVDLGNLSDAAVEAIEGLGVTVHNKGDDKGHYITCKSANTMRAYDNDGIEIDADIGNGSKAVAVVGYFDWSFRNKSGRSPNLKRLKITELVEYTNDDAAIEGEAL